MRRNSISGRLPVGLDGLPKKSLTEAQCSKIIPEGLTSVREKGLPGPGKNAF